ncbi:unnamed protein product [Ectocarpus sp. 4 AP-2014]
MDRRNNTNHAKVWPAFETGQDDDIFKEVDFGNEGNYGIESDLDSDDDAIFSRVDFDESGSLLKSRKVGKRQGADSTSPREGGGKGRGQARTGRGGGSAHLEDSTDDDDDDEVVFGQEDERIRREREDQEKRRQKQHMDRLAKQVKALMERVYEFREQAAKAKQEVASQQEENKELKMRMEQMREDHSELMVAQARGGLTGGINRANARDSKNTRDREAEMRRRRLAKNALLAGVVDEEEDLVITLEGISTSSLAQLSGRFYRWLGKKLPLGADVRAIQARYGSAVASYFHFYRWLVGTYIFIASLSLVWIVFHVLKQVNQGSASVFSASLVGIIPSFLAYSSFDSSNRNLYAIMVVLTTTVQIVSATVKWIREDKIRKELFIVDEEQKHVQFAKTFLVGWDNSLSNQQEVEDYRLSNGLAAANMLAEVSQADVSATRSLDDKIWLYSYRCFGFALYVGVQMAAWAAIIFLTAESDNVASGLAQQLQSVAWISQAAAVISTSIVPATVTVINAIMPIIIKAITKLEKWDMERTVTYMLTIRMFLAKILNAFIQALSYLLLADPYLFAGQQYTIIVNRGRVEQNFEPSGFDCRLDQAGAGLFQLVVTEFVFSKIINYATLRAAQVKARYSKKLFVKPEFEVAKRMVGLLYFQALILAAYPFFPMGTVFVAPFLILSFKFEKKLLTTFQSKPKGRLKAHDSYSFFIKFYLATLVLLGVMATLFLIMGTTFAKNCDIQDGEIGLCEGDVQSSNATCTLDPVNAFYGYFSENCQAPADEYPACVCKDNLACGPFVEVTSAYNSLNTQVRSISIVGYIFGTLVDNSFVLWGAAIVLWLTILFQRNSSQTHADAAADREREWMNEAQTTQARLKKQAKLIEKMQLQAGAMLFDETGGG